MNVKIPVLLMLPPRGSSEAEAWVAAGRLAAACDLAERVKANPFAGPCFLLAHEQADQLALQELGFDQIQSSTKPFHFGAVLAEIISEYHLDRLAYFGGASAPLMGEKIYRKSSSRSCDRKRQLLLSIICTLQIGQSLTTQGSLKRLSHNCPVIIRWGG